MTVRVDIGIALRLLTTELVLVVLASAILLIALPVTVSELNVPTLVMFGCAAVVNVPVNKLADRFPVTLALPPTDSSPLIFEVPVVLPKVILAASPILMFDAKLLKIPPAPVPESNTIAAPLMLTQPLFATR